MTRLLYLGLESQNWVLNLCNELAKLGNEVVAVTQEADDYDPKLKTKLHENVTHHTIKLTDNILEVKPLFKKIKDEKFDIIFGSHAPVCILVNYMKHYFKCKGVVMLLDIPTDLMEEEKERLESWKKWFVFLKNTDMILVNTTVAKNEFKKWTGIEIPKENVIFYAIELSNAENVNPYESEEKILLTSSRLHVQKRNHFVLNALNQIKNTNLKHIALGRDFGVEDRTDGDTMSEVMSNFAKKNNINFKYMGIVSEKKKWSLLKGCEILLYPQATKYIGGLSPFEGLYAGKKVIVSDVPVLHELFGKHVIYFKPDDVSDLAKKIEQTLEIELTEEQVKERKQYVKDVASFPVMAKKINERLKWLMKN